MKQVICSIRDSKAEAWLTPMFFLSPAQAVRSFVDAVNDPQSDFAKHPEDYVLFSLGSFDPSTGAIEPWVTGPESLGIGINFVKGA